MKIEFDPFAGSQDPNAPAEGDVILRVSLNHGIDHDDAGHAIIDRALAALVKAIRVTP